jgi:hypothetical protein
LPNNTTSNMLERIDLADSSSTGRCLPTVAETGNSVGIDNFLPQLCGPTGPTLEPS